MKLPGDFIIAKKAFTVYRERVLNDETDEWKFRGAVFAPKGLYTIIAVTSNKSGSFVCYVWGEKYHGWTVQLG